MYKRPIVAIKNTGGIAERYADQYLDHRQNVKIIGVTSPKEAIKVIFDKINSAKK